MSGKPYGSENLLLIVFEVQIPADKVLFAFHAKSSVKCQFFFEVREIIFQPIGGVRDLGIIQIMKHIFFIEKID